MSLTHPKLDLISAPLSSFYSSAPFLGGGRWTPAHVRGAVGGELKALHPSLVFEQLLLRSTNKPQVYTDVLLRLLTAKSPTAWFEASRTVEIVFLTIVNY